MKAVTLELKNMSDSKEVYGQRPNPFFSAFIYSIVALVSAALIYSFVGKIEIVATATGIIRPNEDVNTVASLVSGKITGVYYTDGQIVQEGDKLFSVDVSNARLSLTSLNDTLEAYQTDADMCQKFLDGIASGENPFSPDADGDEYPYYIQYQEFELALKSTTLNSEYDANKVSVNIKTINEQIVAAENSIAGLKSYKDSIEQGNNLSAAYPEYENQYFLYLNTLDNLKSEYEAQKKTIELDSTAESTAYYTTYYQAQIEDYQNLIQSIESGRSVFPANVTSTCKTIYDDYVYSLEEYRRSYESAKDTYDYYASGGSVGDGGTELLAYDRAMLEGYTFFKQSVIDGADKFDDTRDSVFYRSLYTEYKAKYDTLDLTAISASEAYDLVIADPEATEEDIANALTAKTDAESARNALKESTLVTINNSILQIEATIAEKQVSIGSGSLDYNTATAKAQMDSALAAIDAYTNKALSEYGQVLSNLQNKLEEIRLTGQSTQSKDDLLAALEVSYQQSVDQQYYTTINQINSSTQSLEAELISARSNLRLNQIASSLYQNNRDANGVPIPVSSASIDQISALLNSLDSLQAQIDDLDYQIQQTEEQVEQGTILAERTGFINAGTNLVQGDYLSSGTPVATIIPANESEYRVQLYVSNVDIANIEVGSAIKYNIVSLPSSQYGTVDGVVTSISKDALVQDGQYSGYFLVEGTIENSELTDKNGNTANIAIGMQIEAKIVTQEKSIIRYLLEKINLF